MWTVYMRLRVGAIGETSFELCNKFSHSIQGWKPLDYLSNCYPLKSVSAPCGYTICHEPFPFPSLRDKIKWSFSVERHVRSGLRP